MSDNLTTLDSFPEQLQAEDDGVPECPKVPGETKRKTRRKATPKAKAVHGRGKPARVKEPMPAFVDLDEEEEEEDEDEDGFFAKKKGAKTRARKPARPFQSITQEQFAAMQERGYHFRHVAGSGSDLINESTGVVAAYYSSLGLNYSDFRKIPIVVVTEYEPYTWSPIRTLEEVERAFTLLLNRNSSYYMTGRHRSRSEMQTIDWSKDTPIKQCLNFVTKSKHRIYYDLLSHEFILPPTVLRIKKTGEEYSINFTRVRTEERRDRYRRRSPWPDLHSIIQYIRNIYNNSVHSSKFANVCLSNFDEGEVRKMDEDYDELVDGSPIVYMSTPFPTYVSSAKKITPASYLTGRKPFDQDAYLAECVKSMAQTYRNTEEDERRKMQRLQTSLMESANKAGKSRMMAELIQMKGTEHLRDMVERMSKLPNLESFKFERRAAIFTTPVIWSEATERYGTTYPSKYLGKYEIAIDFATGSVKVRNIAMDVRGKYPTTPSTDTDGEFCMGGYSEIIATATASADYEMMLTAILEFVHDTHLGDGGASDNFQRHFFTDAPKKTTYSPYMTFVRGKGRY